MRLVSVELCQDLLIIKHLKKEMGERKLPSNLIIMHHRGTKSFVEGLQFPKGDHQDGKQLYWEEAGEGKQLPELVYHNIFQAMLGLARANLEDKFQYTRYDLEDIVEETPDNAPYQHGHGKTVNIFGFKFHHK